jgi:hypothetical protein
MLQAPQITSWTSMHPMGRLIGHHRVPVGGPMAAAKISRSDDGGTGDQGRP